MGDAQHKERREEAHLIAKLRDARDAIAAAPRAQRPRYPKVADRGVSLRFAQDFHAALENVLGSAEVARRMTSEHIVGDRDPVTDEPIGEWPRTNYMADVRPWSILALESVTLVSLVETLYIAAEVTGDPSFLRDADGRPYFGKPSVFVSYTWRNGFGDVVAALQGIVGSDAFVWWDIFAIAQCNHTSEAKANLKEDLNAVDAGGVVAACARLCLVVVPWEDPKAFGRVWCLNEVHMAIKAEKEIRLVMPPRETDRFLQLLVDDFDSIEVAVSKIDMRKAQATKEEDRERILRQIEESIGFNEVNKRIILELRKWLARVAKTELDILPWTKQATSALTNSYARLLCEQCKLDDAEPLFREALDGRRATLGDRHSRTLTSIHNCAMLLKQQGKLDDAEPM